MAYPAAATPIDPMMNMRNITMIGIRGRSTGFVRSSRFFRFFATPSDLTSRSFADNRGDRSRCGYHSHVGLVRRGKGRRALRDGGARGVRSPGSARELGTSARASGAAPCDEGRASAGVVLGAG